MDQKKLIGCKSLQQIAKERHCCRKTMRNDVYDPGAQVFTRIRQAAASWGSPVPGEAFYHDEEEDHLARFCFAKKDAVFDEACKRLNIKW